MLALNGSMKLSVATWVNNSLVPIGFAFVGIRDELRAVADMQRSLRNRRAAVVERARAEGLTWREISGILDMTQQGLIKAHKAWEARGKPEG